MVIKPDGLTGGKGVKVFGEPISLDFGNFSLYVGHGDGLGPGDRKFKFFKGVFLNPLAQWAFRNFHPDYGISVATKWSNHSKKKEDISFHPEKDPIIIHCKQLEQQKHHDYYVFGHRHEKKQYQLNSDCTYFNLGEWISDPTYLCIDHEKAELKSFAG